MNVCLLVFLFSCFLLHYGQVESENVQLKDRLAAAQSEASVAKADLLTTQENMQREFASLWMAVQELNKIDATKEQALADLISDRDRTAAERDKALQKLHEYSQQNKRLHSELQVCCGNQV